MPKIDERYRYWLPNGQRNSQKPQDIPFDNLKYWIVNGDGELLAHADSTIGAAVRHARQVAREHGARVYLMTRIKGRVRMVVRMVASID